VSLSPSHGPADHDTRHAVFQGELRHWSGGDWRIGYARKDQKRKRWDSQRGFTGQVTLGAMNMGVKQYNADIARSMLLVRWGFPRAWVAWLGFDLIKGIDNDVQGR
jgi:hypothetical protein